MNIQQLTKALKYKEELDQVNTAIEGIEEYAQLLADGETETIFEMRTRDLKKQRDAADKIFIDEHGDIKKQNKKIEESYVQWARAFFPPTSLHHPAITRGNRPKWDGEIAAEISVNESLAMLGVLLRIKQERKMFLQHRLIKMGVEV